MNGTRGARWWSGLCAVVLLTAAGCATRGTATVEKRGMNYRVAADSMILENRLHVTESIAEKVNNLLDVQVRTRNVTGKTLDLQYRFVWIDDRGVVADTPVSIWQPLLVKPGETTFLRGMASSPDATDFLLTIRLK